MTNQENDTKVKKQSDKQQQIDNLKKQNKCTDRKTDQEKKLGTRYALYHTKKFVNLRRRFLRLKTVIVQDV